ncbi:MAG: sulfatase, partial [Armatimonadota bacterium]
MIRHLRLLSPTVLHSASIGGIAGIVFAAREIAAHDYLRHHLWRTALWIASRDAAFGALLGGVTGALMVLSLAAWQARLPSTAPDSGTSSASPEPAVTPRLLRRFAAFFAACSAAALLLMPAEAPQAFGLSHWYLVAASLALAWIVVRSSAVEASLSADRDGPSLQFALLWSVAVTLAYVLGLAHLWARAWPGWITACAACVGLLAALAVYAALRRPVRWLAERLGGVVPARLPAGLHVAAVLTMICLAVLWACGLFVGRRTRAWAAASGTNIIVIAVDTLRWDATSLLSPDEHERDCTPNTRRLLTPRSTVFTHAYSQAPWTLPSFGSIFTGLYPEQHGGEHVWSRLGPEQATLAEILRDRGYQTMAVVSGHYVTSEVGMLQGFGLRDETMALGGAAVTSEGVTDGALAFIEAADPDRPFFLFAHYFDPHYPYIGHREVDLGRARADGPAPAERGPRPFPPGGGEPGRGGFAFSADRATYDEEVAYVDLHIGRLLTF